MPPDLLVKSKAKVKMIQVVFDENTWFGSSTMRTIIGIIMHTIRQESHKLVNGENMLKMLISISA